MKAVHGTVNGCVSSSSDVLHDAKHTELIVADLKVAVKTVTDVENHANNQNVKLYQSKVLSSTTKERSDSEKSESVVSSSTALDVTQKQVETSASSSPGIRVMLPSATQPSSQTQGTVVTAFLAPVHSAKKVTSPVSANRPPVVQAATLSGPKILVAQPSSVVNGQLRQNVVPVSSAGTTIVLAQGSSMLSMPTKTVTTSGVNMNSVVSRKYIASPSNTLTLPYNQSSIVRTSLPIGTSVNSSINTHHQSLPITFSIASSKTVMTSSAPVASNALSPGSIAKNGPFAVQNGNKVFVNFKQTVQHSAANSVHSTYSSSSSTSHRYYGLPYQDHNYGAPPPPTPPQSPPPPPTVTAVASTILSPKREIAESSIISVDEDTNTSIASSVSTETALSTNGDDIEVTVSSTVNDLTPEVKAPAPSDDISVTRCICEFNHDDEYMICCDKCLVWQHLDCMGISRNDIPDTYLCETCLPRKVDIRRAKSLQSKKRGKLRPVNSQSDTSSAEESKDENRLKQVVPKNRKLKRRDKKPENKTPILKKKAKKVKDIKVDVKKANMRRRRKSRSNSFHCIDEETKDSWDSGLLREWIDKYEEALINQYTPEIQLLVSSLQLNGKNEEMVKNATKQLRAQLCRVAWNASSGRRLLSTCDIECNQFIIEYRGKFLSVSQFKDQNPLFSNKYYPFVLFYSPGVDEEDVCVDAREYGNTARFVRRSCTPNAQVRHVVENGLLHLYLFSLCNIAKDDEITIPFDFNYRKCVNKVECACSKEKCSVATVIIKKNGLNTTFPAIEKKKPQRRKSESVAEHLREKPVPAPKPVKAPPPCPVKSPKKPVSPLKVSHSNNISCDSQPPAATVENGQSGIDNEAAELANDRKTKMTREERKMEAIMKAFERMEKTEKRRQQALERISQKHGPDGEICDKARPNEPKDSPVKQEAVDSLCNAVATGGTSPGTNQPVDEPIKSDEPLEDNKPAPQRRKGKKRKASGTPNKRRLRTVSGSSDQSNIMSSADESGYITSFGGVLSTPNTPFTADADSSKSAGSNCPFRFPKTKKTMMSDWLHEKSDFQSSGPPSASILTPTSPLSVKTDGFPNHGQHPLAISDCVNTSSQLCYVRNIRGNASGINVAHLRRNSCSEKDKVTTPCESNMGSAKKRWLRQVMHEEEVVQDTPAPASSGSPLPSPCASPPTDTITPLKKRRLMRESMSSESCAPSSPVCTTNGPSSLTELKQDPVVDPVDDSKSNVTIESNQNEVKSEPDQPVTVDSNEQVPVVEDVKPFKNDDQVEHKDHLDDVEDVCKVDDDNEHIDDSVDDVQTPTKDEITDQISSDVDLVKKETDIDPFDCEEPVKSVDEQNVGVNEDPNPIKLEETEQMEQEQADQMENSNQFQEFASDGRHEIADCKLAEAGGPGYQVTPVKKKVSLSEYRLRKNLTKSCSSTASSPGHSKGGSAPESMTGTPESNSTSPVTMPSMPISLMTPGKSPPKLSTLPLFKNFMEEDKQKKKAVKTSFKDKLEQKKIGGMKEERRFIEEEESHWSSAPTSFEKVTEQQRENLTQRLRREFGLLSEPEERTTSAEFGSEDKDAASIPPPPPKRPSAHFNVSKAYNDEPPPPPPPPRHPPPQQISSAIQYHNAAYTSPAGIAFPAASTTAPVYHHPNAFVHTQQAPPAINYQIPAAAQFQPPSTSPAVLVYPNVQRHPPPPPPPPQVPYNYPYGKL